MAAKPICVVALQNVIRQYHPHMVGVATTCLSETIGDDVRAHLRAVGRELGPRRASIGARGDSQLCRDARGRVSGGTACHCGDAGRTGRQA